MNKLIVVALVATVAWAQERVPAPPANVRKIVEVKHLTGDRAERAVNLVRRFMHPSQVDYDPVLRTIVMIGMPDVVSAGEALFRKFDAPGGVPSESQVQFRFHLVEGSPDATPSGAMPAEIAPALEQMKKTFAYKGYRHVDTLLLQARGSGEAGIAGTIAGTGTPSGTQSDSHRATYNAHYRQADVLEGGKTIVVRGFRFHVRLPITAPSHDGKVTFAESSISTDFTIGEGQKLVIGKVSAPTATNAIFVIVTVDVQ